MGTVRMILVSFLQASLVRSYQIPTRRVWLLRLVATTPSPCLAACLKGDDSVSCLGTYKEYAEDITKSDADAAGIQWIEPDRAIRTTKEAIHLLKEQRAQLHIAALSATASNFEDSGRAILRLRPRVKAATTFLLLNSKRQQEITLLSAAVDRTIFAIDEADMALGYVVRTENPTIPDLITVTDSLNSAETEFDTLLRFF